MQRTKVRKRSHKRRVIGIVVWRCVTTLIGILILIVAWNFTSFALSHLMKGQAEEVVQSVAQEEELQKKNTDEDTILDSVIATDILLVNKENPLPESYKPTLTRMRNYGADVDASIVDPLNEMLAAGEKEGLSFWIASSYRSLERQRELLDEDIAKLVKQGYSYSAAYEEVVKETMPVGCSEHATGLAVDIVARDYQILDAKQGKTDEIIWLQQNCSKYGFILRYPEGKEDITKVSYESWHFRYVGVDAATAIMSQGITLEEYLESSSL